MNLQEMSVAYGVRRLGVILGRAAWHSPDSFPDELRCSMTVSSLLRAVCGMLSQRTRHRQSRPRWLAGGMKQLEARQLIS
jgi:hypothetical protein